MAGLGSTAAKAIANALIVLVIVSILVSAIFVEQGDRELKGYAYDLLQARIRALRQRGVPVTTELIQKMNLTIYKSLGLLEPPFVRIMRFALWSLEFNFNMFQAKMHYPGAKGNTATDVILAALPNTVILFTTATLVVIAVGIWLGLQIARKAGSIADKTVSFLAMLSASLPMWWVGMLMLLVFAFSLHLAPFASLDVYSDLAQLSRHYTGFMYWLYSVPIWMKYMWLPLLTIIIVTFGSWAYIIRNVVISVMTEDFVYVARAKGLPERTVLYKHVLRSASPPIVTMSALSIVSSLGGAIITETVFSWPGMGRTYWVALLNGDVGVLIAITYMTSFLFVAVIVSLDFIYALLDPRVRTGARGAR